MYNRSLIAKPTAGADAYWNEQQRLRNQILADQAKLEKTQVSELDRYKQDVINAKIAEVKEYERTHGFSGNFLKDFTWGVTHANDTMLKPFNKYIAPVLSAVGGPIGKSIATTTSGFSGVVDRLK